MGGNRDLRSEKTRGMFHYLTKRLPTIRQPTARQVCPHKQEMESPYCEGTDSIRTCATKALQNKDKKTKI